MQDVRYAPSGDHFSSVGSDSKVFVYDGKTGETIAEFTDSPHDGSIVRYLRYCLSARTDLCSMPARGVPIARTS